jgi:hypothetical protein
MDARRLGTGISLPQTFLEASATGYLTAAEWDGLREDWLEKTLAYTADPCKGAHGPWPASAPPGQERRPQPQGPAPRHRRQPRSCRPVVQSAHQVPPILSGMPH